MCGEHAVKSICLYVYALITFRAAIFSKMRRHLFARGRGISRLCIRWSVDSNEIKLKPNRLPTESGVVLGPDWVQLMRKKY